MRYRSTQNDGGLHARLSSRAPVSRTPVLKYQMQVLALLSASFASLLVRSLTLQLLLIHSSYQHHPQISGSAKLDAAATELICFSMTPLCTSFPSLESDIQIQAQPPKLSLSVLGHHEISEDVSLCLLKRS